MSDKIKIDKTKNAQATVINIFDVDGNPTSAVNPLEFGITSGPGSIDAASGLFTSPTDSNASTGATVGFVKVDSLTIPFTIEYADAAVASAEVSLEVVPK